MSKLKDEAGAIAPMFAIFLSTGVLLGLLALVVDDGQAQVEKQAVQQGADAVAEALGQHCADEYQAVNCLTDSFNLKSQVSGAQIAGTATATNPEFLSSLANPKGGAVTVTSICGQSSEAPALPGCPPLPDQQTGCKTQPATTAQNWLRVITQSSKAPTFAGANASPLQYLGCAQVAWGKANSMPLNASGTQLPLMIGLCDVRLGAPFVQAPLTGNDSSRAGCPNFHDKDGSAFSSTAHGWLAFNPASASSACWTIQQLGCTPLPLPSNASDIARISALATAANANLNRVSVVPVFSYQTPTQPIVVAYVPFLLTGYRFFQSSAGVGCSSNLCIAGSFKTRVIQPYGQVQGLGIAAQSNVPNLGFQVLAKMP